MLDAKRGYFAFLLSSKFGHLDVPRESRGSFSVHLCFQKRIACACVRQLGEQTLNLTILPDELSRRGLLVQEQHLCSLRMTLDKVCRMSPALLMKVWGREVLQRAAQVGVLTHLTAEELGLDYSHYKPYVS